MRSTPSLTSNKPKSSTSNDMSNANEESLSLGSCRNSTRPTYPDQVLLQQQPSSMTSSQTLYIPIASPPTPAPSPGPVTHQHHQFQGSPFPPLSLMDTQNPEIRRHFLSSVVSLCTPGELMFVSQTINLLFKRDFLYSLPTELSLYTLTFIDEPKTLMRASQVSKHWRTIVRDESLWKRMCLIHGFDDWDLEGEKSQRKKRLRIKSKAALFGDNGAEKHANDINIEGRSSQMDLLKADSTSDRRSKRVTNFITGPIFSYRRHFRTSYIIRRSLNSPLIFLSSLILI